MVYVRRRRSQRNEESTQQNHNFVATQLSTLLKLMKGEENDEEKTSIYGNEGRGFDETNVVEEHTVAISASKSMASTCKWQQGPNGDPRQGAANPSNQPPSRIHLSTQGERVAPANSFLERANVWHLNIADGCHRPRFLPSQHSTGQMIVRRTSWQKVGENQKYS